MYNDLPCKHKLTSHNSTPNKRSKSSSPVNNKCIKCNIKITFPIECRCGGFYCGKHRYPHKHNCNFDYVNMKRLELGKTLERVIESKMDRISDDEN